MPSSRQSVTTVCFCLALAGYWFGPRLLVLDEYGLNAWAVLGQIVGPTVAAVCCFIAARRGEGGDRTAWVSFGIGSTLYLTGNLFYLHYGLAGIVPTFPAAPEATYFIMALFFAAGMFQYGKVMGRVNRIDICNFILICCAVTLASLLILSQSIANSVMGPFGTIVAFLYPAIWFSVAASGLISLMLYDQGPKSFAFVLLIMAVFAEAGADFQYALRLMDGSYRLGGLIQLLWVASAGLIAWAAAEQISMTRRAKAPLPSAAPVIDRSVAQAAIPAVAVGIVLLSGSATGALGSGPYVVFSFAVALALALVAGFREYWIIHVQRTLRATVEHSGAELAKSRERLTSVLESTSDSILVLDRDWRVEFFNQRAIKTANTLGKLAVGTSFWEAFPVAFGASGGERYRKAMETQQPVEFEEYIEGADIWLDLHAYPTDEGLSIFFRDISERRRIRDEIMHMAHHDPLTGLANRMLFRERLKQAVESGTETATLLLDLDHFKEINDTLGHAVGDMMLAETADRLRKCLRSTDTIARLGGDEFAIMLADHSGKAEVIRLSQRIIDAVTAPHLIDGQPARVGASIGIALSTDGTDDPDQVFKNADIALYIAKAEARGAFRFFDPAMVVGIRQRQALRADLRVALDNGEFELNYQPVVDLHSSRVCEFEALLRWNHPTQGTIPSDVFIPIAEETGLIIAIGDWVLRTACLEAARWSDGISVAVNLSTHQLSSGDLIDKIEAILAETGLEPGRLELEITESVLLEDTNANLLTLKRLQGLGIRIALDDFGTGYSSLGYLQKFHFSKIKIDRSFISGLPVNIESQAIVRSVIGLGKSLGMRVTAEGVETETQFDWVKAGCDEAQGYYLSRPVPAAAIAALLGRLSATMRAPKSEVTRLAS